MCAISAPWAGIAFAAARWQRAGGSVADVVGGRPSLALVEAVMTIEEQREAEQIEDMDHARRAAEQRR